jgi:hypothetical protein
MPAINAPPGGKSDPILVELALATFHHRRVAPVFQLKCVPMHAGGLRRRGRVIERIARQESNRNDR